MDVRFFNSGESLEDCLQRTADGGRITLPQTGVALVEIGGGALRPPGAPVVDPDTVPNAVANPEGLELIPMQIR